MSTKCTKQQNLEISAIFQFECDIKRLKGKPEDDSFYRETKKTLLTLWTEPTYSALVILKEHILLYL